MSIPSFTESVPDNGYRWWYLDAVSEDDQHALTVIVFIGSVFSPYYARARKRGNSQAAAHCAVNVALYGAPWRWCMTERDSASLRASTHHLSIGKSQIRLEGGELRVLIDEVAVPIPSRVRGELRVRLPDHDLARQPLDSTSPTDARHFWQPIAPQTTIDVQFERPHLQWRGTAYVDSNYGSVPLESSFKSWVWSRTHADNNVTDIHYDVVDLAGNESHKSLRYSANGELTHYMADQNMADHTHQLPATRYWRIPRPARTISGAQISELHTLEDTPFYSRSRFRQTLGGPQTTATQALQGKARCDCATTVHESLYLNRFDSAWVRCLLPFRMPRSTRPLLID